MADRYTSDNPEVDRESEGYNEWLIALALLLLAGDITREDYEAQMIYEAGRRTLTAVTLGSGAIAFDSMLPFLKEQQNVIRDSSQAIASAIASGRYTDTAETAGAKLLELTNRLTLWTTAVVGRSYSQGKRERKTEIVIVDDTPQIVEAKQIWMYTPGKKHCPDCERFNGHVMTVGEWARLPSPQGHDLACGGWACGCRLVPVPYNTEVTATADDFR